jgi:hypothetical protein
VVWQIELDDELADPKMISDDWEHFPGDRDSADLLIDALKAVEYAGTGLAAQIRESIKDGEARMT